MKYLTNKHGFVSATIQTMNRKAITTNIIMDSNINSLRKRIGNFIQTQIKNMKLNEEMVMWKTSVGEFCIYKESSLDYCLDYNKSKYKYIETKLEINPIKGDVRSIIIKSRKTINPEYEGLEECASCNIKTICNYKAKRWGEIVNICKKCKQFDTILDKLAKKEELTKSELRSLTI